MMLKKIPLLDTSVSGRICWECKHVYYSSGSEGYSDFTPGSDISLSCMKSYWELHNCSDTLADVRRKLLSAEHCADFESARA